MPAAGFVRQGAGAVRGRPPGAELAAPRAAVVGGFPAGGLRRDRSATIGAKRRRERRLFPQILGRSKKIDRIDERTDKISTRFWGRR